MAGFSRLKNRLIATAINMFPSLADRLVSKVPPLKFDSTPWVEVEKPLSTLKLALVTTAGLHLKSAEPFNMTDEKGDPSYRTIPSDIDPGELVITHDYYDHSDADKDINIVFPMERLRELVAMGRLGSLSPNFYGFMGHITEDYIDRFVNKEIPAVANALKENGTDIALITPG